MSVTPVANEKVANGVKPGSVQRSPAIYLTVPEISRKPQLRDRLIKAVRPVITSNGVPYLQMWAVGSHSTSGREKKGKKGGGKGLGCKESNGDLMTCEAFNDQDGYFLS